MSPKAPKTRNCGQMIVHEFLVETQPGYREGRIEAEEQARASISSGEAMRVVARDITLNVVVHVVYNTDQQNISDEQVQSQIEALNRDFGLLNDDRERTPDVWKGLLTDAHIDFVLATEDPDGNPTPGITRTQTDVESFGIEDEVKSSATGGIEPWPTDRYLNLWVCQLGNNLLGYAQFPGGAPETDGVVILYTAFGTMGTVQEPFNLGRTATHEVGHWAGLRHIWGDRNDGTGTDFVADTPPALKANVGKPEFPHITVNNGPSGDMFMNYMDYVDDDAMFMFTAGQVARMNATMATTRRAIAGL